jgi:hypothetical protein
MAKTQNPMQVQHNANKAKSPFERVQEERRQQGVDWTKVDPGVLVAALAMATTTNATVVVSQAMGGIGVCVRIWQGDNKFTEYAADAASCEKIFEGIAEFYAGSSVDVWQVHPRHHLPTS